MRCWIMLASEIRCPCCGERVKRILLSMLLGCISGDCDCGDGFDGGAA
jgi:hypothetical protein